MIVLGFVVALLDLDILSPVDTHLSLICSDSLLERFSIHFSVLILPVILLQRDDNASVTPQMEYALSVLSGTLR